MPGNSERVTRVFAVENPECQLFVRIDFDLLHGFAEQPDIEFLQPVSASRQFQEKAGKVPDRFL